MYTYCKDERVHISTFKCLRLMKQLSIFFDCLVIERLSKFYGFIKQDYKYLGTY